MGMNLETREFLRSINDTPERREEEAFCKQINEAYGPWKANQDQMERNIAARAAEQKAKKREIEDLAAGRREIKTDTEAMRAWLKNFKEECRQEDVAATILSNINEHCNQKKERQQLEAGLSRSENCLAAAKAKLEAAEANNDEEAAAAAAKDIEMYTTRVDFYTGQIRRTFAE